MISDYGDVRSLQTAYHIAADYPEAVTKAVNAGVDVAVEPSTRPAGTPAPGRAQRGRHPGARVNEEP